MLKPLAVRLLQHITSQNLWSRTHLSAFAGQVVRFEIAFVVSHVLILDDGSLSLAGETASPDATVTIPAGLALWLLAQDEAAKMQIAVQGDHDLARALGNVLPLMRWDIEEDLSQIIGDIPAHSLRNAGEKVSKTLRQQGVRFAEMLSEYWQEEKPILAKKTHVTSFNHAVDTLKADLDRFEKRLEKINQTLLENNEA